ncbi:hypothetical protein V6N13_110707 [Hibiscus sabdariffa]|uniref:Uncharacterized protein n=1 Tax=Hibiscus sabdariffa TaxID=183260 RepID=A0ABR2TIQ5_9ROSI
MEISFMLLLRNPKRAHLFQKVVLGAPRQWVCQTEVRGSLVATASITTAPEVAADTVPVQAILEGSSLDRANVMSDDDAGIGKDWSHPVELGWWHLL